VKVVVGLTTLDRATQRVLEPLAAPPRLRLRQLEQLTALGVNTQVALEPLIPGLTDTRENLEAVLEAVALAGVRRVTTGYMFLRSRVQENLERVLKPRGIWEDVAGAFRGGPVLEGDTIAAARYLPRWRRQRTYATLMALGARLGITVTV